MKLIFDDITARPEKFEFVGGGWFPFPQGGTEPPVAEFSVQRLDRDTALLEGRITGATILACDRCGDESQQPVQTEFLYRLKRGAEELDPKTEIEFSEEEAETLFLSGPVVDVEEILREQSILALPLRVLCQEDCRGICPGCGVSLNAASCQCTHDPSGSPFAVLAGLRKQTKD